MKLLVMMLLLLSTILGCSSDKKYPTYSLSMASVMCKFIAENSHVPFSMKDPDEHEEYICSLEYDSKSKVFFSGSTLYGAYLILRYQQNIVFRPKFNECTKKMACYSDQMSKPEDFLKCVDFCQNETKYKIWNWSDIK
jgi:hypothetical protein